jgi:hypothetical protein
MLNARVTPLNAPRTGSEKRNPRVPRLAEILAIMVKILSRVRCHVGLISAGIVRSVFIGV